MHDLRAMPTPFDNTYDLSESQLVDLEKNLSDIGLKIKIYKSAKNLILEKGYSIDFGVRFLRRTIQTMLEDPISNLLFFQSIPINFLFCNSKSHP